ncbi:glycosyltransferase [Salisediminibacterium beveridgei]|uniref:Glycosyltransferase, cellulose synthase superfamily-like n=1 Tax=Salisediminibacterium beveridgei TaxID=632773 RepID=A0A1D7QYD4_9BACI|nr:glycosyltransferase family 2 protein [Salisediminibacterium beveridgei]AOM84017.1 glycosyltransferase, cellulose synthase superfamily-like [Salisediminibacterium beveridgei]
MIYLAIVTLIIWAGILIDTLVGFRKFPKLEEYRNARSFDEDEPLVSVIIAARDEGSGVLDSIASQLKQSYRNIEWILVNDRSSDDTGSCFDQLAEQDPRVRAVHLTDLPAGWLGKNHALHRGVQKASGDYLVFADADVYFKPHTVSGAMAYMADTDAAHVTMTPEMTVKTFWTQAFVHFFLFGFSYYKRPWKANDDNSKHALGIGAFNLIRRDAYDTIGTHEAIRMRPDDDLMLGLKVKEAGLRQRVIEGTGGLAVEWYPSLKEAVKGLEKNTFAGLHYSWFMVLFALAGVFISQVFPFIALFITTGVTQGLYSAVIVILLVIYVRTAFHPWPKVLKTFLVFPFSAVLFMFTILRSVLLTVIRGGIVWRGTFYPLKELKKQQKE